MAFFKFRLPGQTAAPRGSRDTTAATAQAESVDAMRRRARHRLIGAAVLVLAAVIGFPLLFDSQPRPVSVDVPINIPDRHRSPPLSVPGGDGPVTPAAPAGTPGQVGAAASLDEKEEVVTASRTAPAAGLEAKVATPLSALRPQAEQKPEPKPLSKPEPKAEPRATSKPEVKPEPKPVPKAEPKPAPKADTRSESVKSAARADDGDKARALLEGKELASAATAEASRVVVQVGAFSDADKARETRQKLEQAGLKTFTQVVETKDGKRIRVRVGPFASKADADKAAGKIRRLDLPAAILTP